MQRDGARWLRPVETLSMKVYVLGKARNITGWLEGCVAGLRLGGHSVRVGITRHPILSAGIEKRLMSAAFGPSLAERLGSSVARFRPDLVIGVLAYTLPVEVLAHIASLPGRPPLVGWVGDVFSPAERDLAEVFDLAAYTDTALLRRHRELGFRSPATYLPHAADPRLAQTPPSVRGSELVFVGTPSRRRRDLFGGVRAPLHLYGSGWRRADAPNHRVTARRVGRRSLGRLYASALAVVNAPNEENVLNGLNQRNFDPYVCGTAVITEDQPDLARCFEPGAEVFTYRTGEELDAVCRQVLASPEMALKVGVQGQRRVAAEHTYAHRLQAIVRAL